MESPPNYSYMYIYTYIYYAFCGDTKTASEECGRQTERGICETGPTQTTVARVPHLLYVGVPTPTSGMRSPPGLASSATQEKNTTTGRSNREALTPHSPPHKSNQPLPSIQRSRVGERIHAVDGYAAPPCLQPLGERRRRRRRGDAFAAGVAPEVAEDPSEGREDRRRKGGDSGAAADARATDGVDAPLPPPPAAGHLPLRAALVCCRHDLLYGNPAPR